MIPWDDSHIIQSAVQTVAYKLREKNYGIDILLVNLFLLVFIIVKPIAAIVYRIACSTQNSFYRWMHHRCYVTKYHDRLKALDQASHGVTSTKRSFILAKELIVMKIVTPEDHCFFQRHPLTIWGGMIWSRHVCSVEYAHQPHVPLALSNDDDLLIWATPHHDHLRRAIQWLYLLGLHREAFLHQSFLAVILDEIQQLDMHVLEKSPSGEHPTTSILDHLQAMHLLQKHEDDEALFRLYPLQLQGSHPSDRYSIRIPHEYAVAVMARFITDELPPVMLPLLPRIATRLGLYKTTIHLLQQTWVADHYLQVYSCLRGVQRWIQDFEEWNSATREGLSICALADPPATTMNSYPLMTLFSALLNFSGSCVECGVQRHGQAWVALGQALLLENLSEQGLEAMVTARVILEPGISSEMAKCARQFRNLSMVLGARGAKDLARACLGVYTALRQDLSVETLVSHLQLFIPCHDLNDSASPFHHDFGVQLVLNRLVCQLQETNDVLVTLATALSATSFHEEEYYALHHNILSLGTILASWASEVPQPSSK